MGPVDLQVVRPMQPLGSIIDVRIHMCICGLLLGLFAALAGHPVQPRRCVTVEVDL